MIISGTQKFCRVFRNADFKPAPQQLDIPFLQHWYANVFNLEDEWFFAFLEAKSFYSIVRHNDKLPKTITFPDLMQELINEIITREMPDLHVAEFQPVRVHLCKATSTPALNALIRLPTRYTLSDWNKCGDMMFTWYNQIPQAKHNYHTPQEVMLKKLNDLRGLS